jgi:hypothetical protein
MQKSITIATRDLNDSRLEQSMRTLTPTYAFFASWILVVGTVVASCGSKESSDTPVVVYGNATLSESKGGSDNATIQFTGLTTCSRNADTGRVDVTLTNGTGKPAFAIAIKDYSSTAKTYTCKQAADNATSDTDIGGKFESCMASISVLSTSSATTLNGYSMYRDSTTTKKFTYPGTCTVNVTAASPSIVATVSCTGMVQTLLEGAARNPIDASITATLAGDINCAFR